MQRALRLAQIYLLCFAANDRLAQKIIEFGLKNNDPVWRLPLWEGYKHLIQSNVADLSSTGSTPFGGAITAALFLENFIEGDIPWAHIDLMAYNTRARPGRPEGGEAQAIRGLCHAESQIWIAMGFLYNPPFD